LIVTLTDDGLLEVSYLGTEPPKLAVETTNFIIKNYKRLDQQHYEL